MRRRYTTGTLGQQKRKGLASVSEALIRGRQVTESRAVDEIEAVMHELGSAFAAGLTQPASMQAVLWDRGRWSRTHGAAGNPARIGRWSDTFNMGLFALRARVKSREGVQVCSLWS
jgi:hypothetical protein